MASTYVNNLRLEEIGTGEQSGTWGDTTNTNLEIIGQAVAWGKRAIANASTDNITIADGALDADRCLGLKLTGGGQACTVTLLPNTSSKTWFMYNATAAALTFTCGSGANVIIPAGHTKVIASDGLGSGGVVHDLLTAVNLAGTTTVDDLAVTDDLVVADDASVGGILGVTGVLTTTAATVFNGGFASNADSTMGTNKKLLFRDSGLFINSSTNGQLDIDADTELELTAPTIQLVASTKVDLDGDIEISGTAAITGVVTANAGVVVDNFTLDGTTLALSSGDFTVDVAGDIILDADGGDVNFKDAGTEYLRVTNGASGPEIFSTSNDGDLFLKGVDGGATITALTLDMSDAGTATFNHDIKLSDSGIAKFGTDTDMTIFHNGSNATVKTTTGDLNLEGGGNIFIDAGTDITFDARGSDFLFKKATDLMFSIRENSNNIRLKSEVNNKSMLFMGVDATNEITALTLDMADAGTAIFNNKIVVGGTPAANDAALTLLAAEPAIFFHDTDAGQNDAALFVNNGTIVFKNGANANNVSDLTERMRLDNAGNFFIGKTARSSTQDGFDFSQEGECIVGRGSNDTMFIFQDINTNGDTVGSISMSSNATAYNTSSDYRLKENVDYTWDATTRLKQLKPARFNFISDDTNTLIDGFLAHEAQAVVPTSVFGAKDAVQVWRSGDTLPDGVSVGDNKLDADGNTSPQYQQIDQSKLVPLLVKTIQELEARITVLEG